MDDKQLDILKLDELEVEDIESADVATEDISERKAVSSLIENERKKDAKAQARKKDVKTMLKEALALFIITMVAGLLLGFVYQLTKDPIAKQKELAVKNACSEVMPGADHFTELEYTLDAVISDKLAANGVKTGTVFEAYTSDNKLMGYVIETASSQGYGGDIVLYIGVNPYTEPFTLNGVSILSISETAGLGMRAEEVLVPQFANKQAEGFTFTKTGSTDASEIDAISGATITTKAVTNAVNGGLEAAGELFAKALAEGKVTLDE